MLTHINLGGHYLIPMVVSVLVSSDMTLFYRMHIHIWGVVMINWTFTTCRKCVIMKYNGSTDTGLDKFKKQCRIKKTPSQLRFLLKLAVSYVLIIQSSVLSDNGCHT